MIRPNSSERGLRLAMLVAGDFLIAWACLALAVFIRRNIDFEFTRSLLPPEKFPLNPLNVTLFSISLVVALALGGFYNQRVSRRHRPIVGAALLIQLGIVAIVSTMMERPYPRTILFAVPLFEAVAVPLWRRLTGSLRIRPRETVLFGNADDLTAFIDNVDAWLDERIRIVGLVGPSRPNLESVPYWGTLDDPCVRTRIQETEELIYVSHDEDPHVRLQILAARGPHGYLLLPSQADALLTSATFGWVGDQPLVEIAARCGYGVGAFWKRLIDIVIASLLIVTTAPLWVTIAIAIWLEDRRPILILQSRLGRGGVPFAMWKFRTMHEHVRHNDSSLQLALDDDERVTRVGRWLRRHRVDELPQLVNVLRGQMSLVGPRPERPELVERIIRDVPDFGLRLMIRPGIAGLAQVWAEYDTRPAIKLRYDLTYMCAWSLWLDFRILLGAVSTAMSGRGL
jgi:exopolysaccharide biosynthesis polyprenyl glycosylphosphotransferase